MVSFFCCFQSISSKSVSSSSSKNEGKGKNTFPRFNSCLTRSILAKSSVDSWGIFLILHLSFDRHPSWVSVGASLAITNTCTGFWSIISFEVYLKKNNLVGYCSFEKKNRKRLITKFFWCYIYLPNKKNLLCLSLFTPKKISELELVMQKYFFDSRIPSSSCSIQSQKSLNENSRVDPLDRFNVKIITRTGLGDLIYFWIIACIKFVTLPTAFTVNPSFWLRMKRAKKLLPTDPSASYILIKKYCFFPCWAIPNKNAMTVAGFIYRHIYCRYLCPGECIFSDQGPEFHNNVYKELNDRFGVEIRMSKPGNPKSNGIAEAAVKTMKNKMKCLMSEKSNTFSFYFVVVFFILTNSKEL